jgi:uncharacterized protein YbbC (DUF1343 family)
MLAGEGSEKTMAVQTGLDRLPPDLVRGRRVGIVTNPTGIDARFRRTAAVVAGRGAEIVALFGPEHGYHGVEQAGVPLVEDARDPATGLPISSLYRATDGDAHVFGPPPGSMDRLDLLVFDIQDVGARYYTYPSTLGILMEQVPLPILVIDRPNPIGGVLVEGPVLAPGVSSFVGRYPVPVRHGLTLGELALLINGEFLGGKADVTVAPLSGWARGMRWEEMELPWVPPSPNIPTPETALLYPGTCLFEGTNLSIGRGTTRPFEVFGAPWIEPEVLARDLRALHLPGLAIRPTYFKPAFERFAGAVCGGVQVHLTEEGRRSGAPGIVRSGVRLVGAVARRYPEHFAWLSHHFDRLIGSGRPRTAITESGGDPAALAPLFVAWEADGAAFRATRDAYLRYP